MYETATALLTPPVDQSEVVGNTEVDARGAQLFES